MRIRSIQNRFPNAITYKRYYYILWDFTLRLKYTVYLTPVHHITLVKINWMTLFLVVPNYNNIFEK